MKKVIFLTFIAIFFFSLGATDIYAYSCAKPRSVKETYKTSVSIFSGEVISVTNLGGSTQVKIRVENTWKGSLPNIVEIRGGGMYGYNFTAGEEYLIYADGKSENELYASLCSRTKKFSDAAKDVKILDKLKT